MIQAAICDDDPSQARIITILLDKYKEERPGIDIDSYCFTSGEDLLRSMSDGNAFDLMLLDILMPGLSGIELAREIRKHNEEAVMVFLTISKKHALEAYGVSAVQYILKPLKAHTLFPVLDKIIPTINQEKIRYFPLSTPESEVKIPFQSIICIEHNHRRLKVCLDNGKTFLSKYIRDSFAENIAPLLQDSRFIFAHRSFVINIDKAEELRKNELIMKNGNVVPVSRYKYVELREAYQSYIESDGEDPA